MSHAAAGQVLTPVPFTVCEIGPRGALVELDHPLALDAIVEVRLVLGSEAIVTKARVIHCGVCRVEPGVTYRAGVEFVEPTEHAALIIADFVQGARPKVM